MLWQCLDIDVERKKRLLLRWGMDMPCAVLDTSKVTVLSSRTALLVLSQSESPISHPHHPRLGMGNRSEVTELGNEPGTYLGSRRL